MARNFKIIRKNALRVLAPENPVYEKLIPHVVGNVGFVFTNGDLKNIRDRLEEDRVTAPAKAGSLAPLDVTIPAGNTGFEPSKTSFFQALGIPTKINKGCVEILSDFPLIKAGSKVTASDAILLNMMKISPFTYGLLVNKVFSDGTVFDPSILDIDNSVLLEKYMQGIARVAAISLQIGFPTAASAPHSIMAGFKNVLAVALATTLSFPQAESFKDRLANPDAYASQVTVAVKDAAAPPAQSQAAAPVEEEEEEEDMDFDLFG
ncbi:ribosomal protein P0 (A0) (L10E) [Coelomomyces lativittatus]|nr:ribosomal protein P0 (A0) (L10E) [Coelomomyces lativittatus]